MNVKCAPFHVAIDHKEAGCTGTERVRARHTGTPSLMESVQSNIGYSAGWSASAPSSARSAQLAQVRCAAGDTPPPDDPAGGGPEGDLATATAKPKLKRPAMYKVILMNDDYTPMEFVVEVLETFFTMSREKATQIMLAVHTSGSAVCGIFPRDIAETKSEQVNRYAQENNHPLLSIVEMTD